jgi:hypothetical protein
MEHSSCEEDTFTHFCMGHRTWANHAGYLLYRGLGTVRGVSSALSGRCSHQRMFDRIHRREDFICLPDVSRLSYQTALVLAWIQRAIR